MRPTAIALGQKFTRSGGRREVRDRDGAQDPGARHGGKVWPMRILRISLVALMLAPLGACLVTAQEGHPRTVREPGGAPSGAVVAGQIVDARTNQPISQVAIDIMKMDHQVVTSTSTDGNGNYRTDPVPPGRYIVNIKRNGYAAESHQGYDLGPGTNDLSVQLQPK
jgi:hypothetical protein